MAKKFKTVWGKSKAEFQANLNKAVKSWPDWKFVRRWKEGRVQYAEVKRLPGG